MRLISNIAFMWMIRIATLAASALVSIVTARALGPAGRGLFALPAIDASIAVTLSVGLSSAVSYYLLNRKAGTRLLRPLGLGFASFLVVGSIATILTAAISHSTWAIVPALLYMTCYAGYSVVCGYYFGRDRARTAGLVNGILSLATLVSVSVAIWQVRTPRSAVFAWVLATFVVAVAGMVCVAFDARKTSGEDVDPLSFVMFGAKAGLVNVANLLNYRVDIFIVAMLLPVATVGLYTIAVTGAEAALSVTLAIGQATLPRIGSLDRAQAGAFAARCIRNTLFFAAILCCIGNIAAPLAIKLVFGHAYAPVVAPMRILLVGIVAASTGSILSNYFVLNLGRMKAPLASSLVSTAICGLITIALIPHLGMIGAAIASTAAYAISQAGAILYFCRVSGIGLLEVLFVDRRDMALYGRIARRAVRIS